MGIFKDIIEFASDTGDFTLDKLDDILDDEE